jgi:glycerol uptake facilitator-like aquaporin
MQIPLRKQLLAEFLGTAALLCAVIGSGIMAERLSGGNMGIALIANTLATVFALYVLIEILGPLSGAHFNPLVTLIDTFKNRHKMAVAGVSYVYIAILFIVFQLFGAILGAWLANAMFELPVLQTSQKLRGGWGQWLAEAVATAGLLATLAQRIGSLPALRLPTQPL